MDVFQVCSYLHPTILASNLPDCLSQRIVTPQEQAFRIARAGAKIARWQPFRAVEVVVPSYLNPTDRHADIPSSPRLPSGVVGIYVRQEVLASSPEYGYCKPEDFTDVQCQLDEYAFGVALRRPCTYKFYLRGHVVPMHARFPIPLEWGCPSVCRFQYETMIRYA